MTIKRGYIFSFGSWSSPLAYLVGVYLSDGCVHRPQGRMAIFSHSSIDREYVFKTKTALEVVLRHKVRYREYNRTFKQENIGFKRYSQMIYEVSVSNEDFGNWLECITKSKTIVPEVEDYYLKHLLSGFIDGDGYINIFKDKDRIQKDFQPLRCYQAGICGKGEKMQKIVGAFNKLGVKTGTKTIGKRDVETYKVNLGSLADSGICFSIHRKFFRFCEYVNQVKPSTTIRRTLVFK